MTVRHARAAIKVLYIGEQTIVKYDVFAMTVRHARAAIKVFYIGEQTIVKYDVFAMTVRHARVAAEVCLHRRANHRKIRCLRDDCAPRWGCR